MTNDSRLRSATLLSRRRFLEAAAAVGGAAGWAGSASGSTGTVTERRDLYPEGVGSGDPDSTSVILWTRRVFAGEERGVLRVEVSESAAFSHIIAKAEVAVSPAADWTCRVLIGNLKPSHVYWYRFVDAGGNTSRVGRTITAPLEGDDRPVRFAFVACQNANMGEQHAYRRMIFEDERAPPSEQLEFVLHLGDFIYEVVWYPEERPQGMFGRRFRDIVRYPQGEKVADFHIPATLEDYRAIYRAYLRDPHLQDARARWPFVCIWDNHEFSQAGWQSMLSFEGRTRPAQKLKVTANQAWFEYQPARIVKSSGAGLERFDPPDVRDAPIERFDDDGFGDEPNNRLAVESLTAYRAFRWGRHVELIVTDQRSYRTEEPLGRPEAKGLSNADFPEMIPLEAAEILDAGRAYAGGKPPAVIRIGEKELPNFRRNDPPQSILGATQKKWFLQRLRSSKATWKIWGSTLGTLDYRADPLNLPEGKVHPWPGAGFATGRSGDMSTAYHERAEIYAAVKEANVTGFVTVAGDRHSFWAGLAAPALPPQAFQPVGVAFVVGSISAAGTVQKLETGLVAEKHPLRPLFLQQRSAGARPAPTVNMLFRHGVRSCLEYERTGDAAQARKLSNPDLSPHLSFLDLDGHGFAIVRASRDALECEFVCIPRPTEPVTAPDGGPVLYRVVHWAPLWKKGQAPVLQQRVVDGDPTLSL